MIDIPILICATKDEARVPLAGTVEEVCAVCGVAILRKPDPEVPEEAPHVCMKCGLALIDASGEVPEIIITKQNKELLDQLGYKPHADGEC